VQATRCRLVLTTRGKAGHDDMGSVSVNDFFTSVSARVTQCPAAAKS
jgi:hypothetical protein